MKNNIRTGNTENKKNKLSLTKGITFSLLIFITTNLFALDTTETFTPGAVTEFEGYYSMGANSSGRSHDLELLIGGGFTKNFSYGVTTAITMNGSDTEISSIGLGFTWTIIDNDRIAFDLLPYGGLNACCQEGHISYPGLDAYSFGTDMELNFKFIRTAEPFLQSGFGASYHRDDNKLHWSIPMAVGVMVPLSENTEFFLQAGWAPADENTWAGSERIIAAGLNAMVGASLELITETSWEFSSNNLSLNLGLIYAL